MSEFLGIAREPVFSPGKVEPDRAILDGVAAMLRVRGHAVRVLGADEPLARPTRSTLVFTMSQGEAALATLRRWEADGLRVVNSVAGILGCHRHRLLKGLDQAGVGAPEAVWLPPEAATSPVELPAWLEAEGGWIKRGDVHATQADDVAFVRSARAVVAAAERFRARGIVRAVVQRHVEGAVVKFYGVRGGFFACFSSDGTRCQAPATMAHDLRALGEQVSRAIGLEIYGGDFVVTSTGRVQVIDVNDWPSFGPCRDEAADAIAARLEALSRENR
jgi:hypothetical protein